MSRPPSRILGYLATAVLPPLIADSLGWLWRHTWFRVLLQGGMLLALLAALAWGAAMLWTGHELAALRRSLAASGLPLLPARIPLPVLAPNDNGEPYVRAAQALLGRWSRGYYTVSQPEAGTRLQAAMSEQEWRCSSAEDRTLTLAFLDQPQRLLAWDLLSRSAHHPGIAFPSTPGEEASLMLPQRSVLALARLRVRLLMDANRSEEAEAQMQDLARLLAITIPPPDAVSFLAWHDMANGTIHLLKRLVADGHLKDAAARSIGDSLGRTPSSQEMLLRLADAERLRLDRRLQERTPLLDPLPPEGLVELATQAVIGGAAGDWLGEPLRRHLAVRLIAGNLSVRSAIAAAAPAPSCLGLLRVDLPQDLDAETAETWRFCLALDSKTRRALILGRIALDLHRRHLATRSWPATLDGLEFPVPPWVRWQCTADGAILGIDEREEKSLRDALVWHLGR